jgi:hypothetical protein
VLRMLEQDVHAMNGPQEPTLDQVIDELRDTRR